MRGYAERFTEDDNRKLYGHKWHQYFERLLPYLNADDCMSLQTDCLNLQIKNRASLAKHIKPTDYAYNVLEAITTAGHDQILLSNTLPEHLKWFIETVGLETYLPESKIFGVNVHQGIGNKIDTLKQYLADKNYDDIIIIGDSIGDIALKEVAGGKTYLYCHPHLEQNDTIKSDYRISDLREILQEL